MGLMCNIDEKYPTHEVVVEHPAPVMARRSIAYSPHHSYYPGFHHAQPHYGYGHQMVSHVTKVVWWKRFKWGMQILINDWHLIF